MRLIGWTARLHDARVVLAAAGLCGFLAGQASADWQWAVEQSQVLAGLVMYPPSSPVAIAHGKLWSLTSQAGALLLSVGVSEIALSKLLSGLIGLLSFQALAAIVYAFGRDGIVAMGAVFTILISRMTDYGVVYPIWLIGTQHTHGAIGLSISVLTMGLLGMGWSRSAAFLLALVPALHPALGAWLFLIVGLAMLSGSEAAMVRVRAAWRFFAAGAAITLASFLIFRSMRPPYVQIDAATADLYLRAFVPFWDLHRQPISLGALGIKLSIGVAVVAPMWLFWFGRTLPTPARLLLRIVGYAAVLSLLLAVWSAVAPGTMPSGLVVLMPGRLLNVNIMLATALLFGLAGTLRSRVAAHVLLAILSAALLVSSRSRLWELLGDRLWRLDPLAILSVVGAGLMAAAWWELRKKDTAARATTSVISLPSGRAAAWLRGATVGSLLAALVVAAIDGRRTMHERRHLFEDSTNTPIFLAASHGEGPLLTGGDLFLIQLRTRRPVLLDGGALDTLPYALEAGPAMDRILRDVYGIDLFNPPAEAKGGGRVPSRANQITWQSFPRERWRQIGREYGVMHVLTPAGWALDLPRVARSSNLELYAIAD